MKKKILIGFILLVAIGATLKSTLVPKKINTISIRYAPMYNIATAEALNEMTENGYIDFQTIILEGDKLEKVSKLLKDVHGDKSFLETGSIIGDDYEIIINDNYKITAGNEWGRAGNIDDENTAVVRIPQELSDEIYSIIKNNNFKIFKKISCKEAIIEKDNKTLIINDENTINSIIDNSNFLKVNITEDYTTYDGGYYASIKFDNNITLYIYYASIIGYIDDSNTNQSYFVVISGNLYKIIDSLFNNNSNNDGYVVHCGYLSKMDRDNRDNNKTIISEYDELKKFCDKYNNYIYDGKGNIVSGSLDEFSKKYDANYFSNKSLAIVYVELGSGSYKVQFNNYTINNNSIKINYDIIMPSNGLGTMDMNGYFVVVEVAKNITNID